MSLMGTLAKVAVGVAVAKGMKKVLRGGQQTGQSPMGGGLGSILGQIAGGGSSAGGLGGLLGGLAGGGASGSKLDGMLGSVLGNSQAQGGGLGGLLESLGGGQQQGGFGDRVNQSIENFGQDTQTQKDDEETAKVLLATMIHAAKADGEIDAEEQAAISKHLGDITQEDREFVQQQINSNITPESLAAAVPEGMAQQAYAMSLLAIDLDSKKEAQYLHTFATALKLDAQVVNSIHSQMGEPALYS